MSKEAIFTEFQTATTQKLSDPRALREEFRSLEHEDFSRFMRDPNGRQLLFKSACSVENQDRNRYTDVLPNEDTRVIINDWETEYFNGNIVSPPHNAHKYICCQGPLENTIRDFWKVVEQNKIKVIVMLCKLKENGMEKCAKYWPSQGKPITVPGLTIELLSEGNVQKGFDKRIAVVTNEKTKEKLTVTQFHFYDWPDRGVPDCEDTFIQLMKEVERFQDPSSPTCVHCSAGIGRTGTFIAIQTVLHAFKANKAVTLKDVVRSLKAQRSGMVQQAEQYAFAHRAVLKEMGAILEADQIEASAPVQPKEIPSPPPRDSSLKEASSVVPGGRQDNRVAKLYFPWQWFGLAQSIVYNAARVVVSPLTWLGRWVGRLSSRK